MIQDSCLIYKGYRDILDFYLGIWDLIWDTGILIKNYFGILP